MPDATGALPAVATEPLEAVDGRPLLVLLHGYGADEHDLLPLAEALGGDDVVLSVRGPFAVGAGAAWMDGPSEAVLAGSGLAAAAVRVLRTLDAALPEAGAPSAIRLLGFSQGGALALVLARSAPTLFERVVVLSGFVPAGWADDPADAEVPLPPVFWGSGDADAVIPAAAVARTDAWLRAHADADIRVYPHLAHGIATQEVADVAAFLAGHDPR